MRADFVKMEGAGNDFVVIDERVAVLDLAPARIRELADRRRGIGFDQLVRLRPAAGSEAELRMVIHNADGSEAGACGNATRCVAMLAGVSLIETASGVRRARAEGGGRVTVDMGAPRFDADAIGLTRPVEDTRHLPLPGDPAGCSMGNPHATVFLDADDEDLVRRDGPRHEHDPLFRDRANIGFAVVEAPDRIRLRVWERGAGLTLACGTGACAALVNAHRRGLAARRAAIVLDGGTLEIAWRLSDGHVLMTGPAATSFTGSFEL